MFLNNLGWVARESCGEGCELVFSLKARAVSITCQISCWLAQHCNFVFHILLFRHAVVLQTRRKWRRKVDAEADTALRSNAVRPAVCVYIIWPCLALLCLAVPC